MEKAYDEIMDRIEVSVEMRNRILSNIQAIDLKEPVKKVVRFPAYKKYLSIAACFAVLLVGTIALLNTGRINNPGVVAPEPGVASPGPEVVAPGPGIVEVASAEELSEAVGFEVTDISALPFAVEKKTYTAYFQDVAEVRYDGDEQTAIFRKSIGTEDNSGDFNSYDAVEEISVGTVSVTLKGTPDLYTLAVWFDGEYSYSLQLSKGISETEWRGIISDEG